MAYEYSERETTRQGVTAPVAESTSVERVDMVADDPYAARRGMAEKAVQAAWLVFGVIEGLLVIRLVLKLLGANPRAGFSDFIYSVTGPFVAPFTAMFNDPASGGSVLELGTIIAIIVYALVAWLVARLIWLVAGETRRGVAATTHSVDTDIR